MENNREIRPNAASRDAVERVKARVVALGFDWHAAVDMAGVSRPVGYKLLKGTASLGSLRKIEDWLLREELKRGVTPRKADAKLEEWAQLGRDFMRADPRGFDRYLESLRMLVPAKIQEQRAMALIAQPTPADDD